MDNKTKIYQAKHMLDTAGICEGLLGEIDDCVECICCHICRDMSPLDFDTTRQRLRMNFCEQILKDDREGKLKRILK
jgi:hypothetical protein